MVSHVPCCVHLWSAFCLPALFHVRANVLWIQCTEKSYSAKTITEKYNKCKWFRRAGLLGLVVTVCWGDNKQRVRTSIKLFSQFSQRKFQQEANLLTCPPECNKNENRQRGSEVHFDLILFLISRPSRLSVLCLSTLQDSHVDTSFLGWRTVAQQF